MLEFAGENMGIDKFHHYNQETFDSTLEALRQLGGEAKRLEVVEKTAQLLGLTKEDVNQTNDRGLRVFEYGLSWTRWALSLAGLIKPADNQYRGWWRLSDKGWSTTKVNTDEIFRIRDEHLNRIPKSTTKPKSEEQPIGHSGVDPDIDDDEAWRAELLAVLGKISPYQFELMCGELLRKMGFSGIEVTSKSNDKGIDGFANKKIEGVISFRVAFQCKRYSGTVGAPDIQKFRGSLTPQIDRALLITTGRFSQQAQSEADRSAHTIRIDLIDGNQLIDEMRQFGLGVKNRPAVDEEFFAKYQIDK